MPILAICPYCREGKVRAPDRAVGLSATCPKCFNCFTIIASKDAAAERGMLTAFSGNDVRIYQLSPL